MLQTKERLTHSVEQCLSPNAFQSWVFFGLQARVPCPCSMFAAKDLFCMHGFRSVAILLLWMLHAKRPCKALFSRQFEGTCTCFSFDAGKWGTDVSSLTLACDVSSLSLHFQGTKAPRGTVQGHGQSQATAASIEETRSASSCLLKENLQGREAL